MIHLIPWDAHEFYHPLIGSEDVEDNVEGLEVPSDIEISFEDD